MFRGTLSGMFLVGASFSRARKRRRIHQEKKRTRQGSSFPRCFDFPRSDLSKEIQPLFQGFSGLRGAENSWCLKCFSLAFHKSGTKKQPKAKVFGPDILRTSRGHSCGRPGSKTSGRPPKTLKISFWVQTSTTRTRGRP